MKILCLHGVGSNGSICESQLQPFIRASDPSYEFVFVDGPEPCERGPESRTNPYQLITGMAAYHDGPFFSHMRAYDPQNMQAAIEHLEEVIDEMGPFDGVLGFSQGAALTISFLHQRVNEPLPFKFALCFSSVIPCSADAAVCNSLIDRICPLDSGDGASEEQRLFSELLEQTVIPAQQHNSMLPDYDISIYQGDQNLLQAPRLMPPSLTKEKIRIPTVHMTGKRDAPFMRSMSKAALGLCEKGSFKVLEHSGGHEPPKAPADVKAAVRAMEWAIGRMAHL
ncbi:unnamed protein product [Clonostachys rhizophaga]|uniref:Serine hydrolase domain-containing protein n=1 Tax=Clonostachys rhizophaga TaxID=160324 RepID=A0A9N9YJ63_9HYPO|nr:unnamed protein product [Clonostachys rhizophaga]